MIPIPTRMRGLPRDRHGRPIPWFVHVYDDGSPDFRVIRRSGIPEAYRFKLCWVCGQPRGQWVAFVAGPMCAVNRVSAEPPSHRDCAIYSATACPFLATPSMNRRERGLPEEHVDPPGITCWRNPGVALVWVTRDWNPFRAPDGALFRFGDPAEVLWFANGRPAAREEVQHSIDTGFPLLQEAAAQDGPDALAELDRQLAVALALLPAEEPTRSAAGFECCAEDRT